MNERGSVTLWILGLTVMVVFMGGIALDLWRSFEIRQDLAAMADSAATAAASQIDTDHYRASGEVVLDEMTAMAAAELSLAAQQDFSKISTPPIITVAGPVVSVELEGTVDFTLLKIFLGGDSFAVGSTGSAIALQAP